VTPVRPRVEEGGRTDLKRLYALLSLVVLICVLAMPAVARADDPTPDGWTWDEATLPTDPAPVDPTPDGWTWDEAVPVTPA
jgi:hypothetical protein